MSEDSSRIKAILTPITEAGMGVLERETNLTRLEKKVAHSLLCPKGLLQSLTFW